MDATSVKLWNVLFRWLEANIKSLEASHQGQPNAVQELFNELRDAATGSSLTPPNYVTSKKTSK